MKEQWHRLVYTYTHTYINTIQNSNSQCSKMWKMAYVTKHYLIFLTSTRFFFLFFFFFFSTFHFHGIVRCVFVLVVVMNTRERKKLCACAFCPFFLFHFSFIMFPIAFLMQFEYGPCKLIVFRLLSMHCTRFSYRKKKIVIHKLFEGKHQDELC